MKLAVRVQSAHSSPWGTRLRLLKETRVYVGKSNIRYGGSHFTTKPRLNQTPSYKLVCWQILKNVILLKSRVQLPREGYCFSKTF